MKKQTKRLLVNISAGLVMINAVSVFTMTAYIVNINILGVWWIASMASVLVLLIISSVSKIAKNEKDETNSKNYTPEYDFQNKLPTNIWSRILSCTPKINKIFGGGKIKPQVPQHHETTDNHSFHAEILPCGKEGKQPNANKTIERMNEEEKV